MSLLQAPGQEARAVYVGREALVRVRAFAPDLVILDLGMPEMDGLEVARRLRAEHGDQLLALSGYGQATHHQQTQAAGFDRHLTKPVGLEALQALLRQLPGNLSDF